MGLLPAVYQAAVSPTRDTDSADAAAAAALELDLLRKQMVLKDEQIHLREMEVRTCAPVCVAFSWSLEKRALFLLSIIAEANRARYGLWVIVCTDDCDYSWVRHSLGAQLVDRRFEGIQVWACIPGVGIIFLGNAWGIHRVGR